MSRTNSKLAPLLESMEILEAERKALLEQKNDVLKEAKALGYDTKIVRRILSRRQKERAEVLAEDESLRHFEAEVGMEVLD